MTGFQKFIKYAAIAFGIYLSITIVLVLLGIAREFVGASRNDEFKDLTRDREEYHTENITRTYENIKNLEINVEETELIIKNGDTFRIDGTNIPDRMEIKQDGDRLKVSDEELPSDFSDENMVVTIYVPEDIKLDTIDLEINYVPADIQKLNTANLKLDIYNNYCEIDEIIADNMEFKNEEGNIDIYDAEIGRLLFDSESGVEDVSLDITGNAEINLEYSYTDMNLIGAQEDYQISTRNQSGNIYVDGETITSNAETWGSGNTKINLDNVHADIFITFREAANESNL